MNDHTHDTIIPYGSIVFVGEHTAIPVLIFDTEGAAREIAHKAQEAYARQWPDDSPAIIHASGGHGQWAVEMWEGEDEHGDPKGTVRLLRRYSIEATS